MILDQNIDLTLDLSCSLEIADRPEPEPLSGDEGRVSQAVTGPASGSESAIWWYYSP